MWAKNWTVGLDSTRQYTSTIIVWLWTRMHTIFLVFPSINSRYRPLYEIMRVPVHVPPTRRPTIRLDTLARATDTNKGQRPCKLDLDGADDNRWLASKQAKRRDFVLFFCSPLVFSLWTDWVLFNHVSDALILFIIIEWIEPVYKSVVTSQSRLPDPCMDFLRKNLQWWLAVRTLT